ncbi:MULTISPECIES: hypothetical protein [Aeromonas]|jgi:hypothetical protein|uniref:hypothetical protein n=1 Tax=Aeromonas TaxID=642 RepID=UPI000CD02A1F|nr:MULTISPECIES: hypothetical protein [Aeromonas]AUV15561.1 hypothetical protein C2U47_02115 [Aeromonas sp. ASNIH7]MDM5111896.1 hypothetical protein [Aeromonas caviae]
MIPTIAAPAAAYPRKNTRTRLLLTLLLDGREVPEAELCRKLGHTYRSAIQRLEGERYCWRIINVLDDEGLIIARKLDPRHLTECHIDDARARLERLNELKDKSHRQAMRERQRAARSALELQHAKERLEQFEKENAPEVSPESV